MDYCASAPSRRALVGTAAACALAGLASHRAFAAEPSPAGTTWASATSLGAGANDRMGVEPYAQPMVTYEDDRETCRKRILVVVDYQVDFVDGGAFGTIETARAIEDALYDRIKAFQDAGDILIYTMDTHPADAYAATREGQFNPPHCDPATPGWQVYGRVAELLTPQTALMIRKGTYGSRDLPLVVQSIIDQGVCIESIEFAGVSTTCRVLHNAIILYNFFPTIPMVFDSRTTASYEDDATAAQLDQLEGWGFIVRRG